MPVSYNKQGLMKLLAGKELVSSDFSFSGLEFDSREIKGGELFVALPGEKCHGNSFAQKALDNGAALVLAEAAAPDSAFVLPDVSAPERIILVKDSLKAFWELAAWWRNQLNLPTLAITGSVGKTTCKEIAASILKQYGPGCYSLKSHNNHVGVPYTICRSSNDDRWLILEIGMNNRGEIAPLSELARPDLAAISAIAPAHIGNLGSIQEIIQEKLDITKGLSAGSRILIGLDQKLLLEAASKRTDIADKQIEFFGFEEQASFDQKQNGNVKEVVTEGLAGLQFKLLLDENWHAVKMKIVGSKNVLNASCAAKACKLLIPVLSAEQIINGLQSFVPPQMRLNLKYLKDKSVIIDDSYNANPASMSAGIELLFEIAKTEKRPDKPIVGLVIGEMLELGGFSEEFHKEISRLLASFMPDFVVAVGNMARFYLKNLPADKDKYCYLNSSQEAAEFVNKFKFDYLLVKGSRGIGLEKVVSFLVQQRG